MLRTNLAAHVRRFQLGVLPGVLMAWRFSPAAPGEEPRFPSPSAEERPVMHPIGVLLCPAHGDG